MVARWRSLRPVGDEALLELLVDLSLQACRTPLGPGVPREVEPLPRRVSPVRQHPMVQRQQDLETRGLGVVGAPVPPVVWLGLVPDLVAGVCLARWRVEDHALDTVLVRLFLLGSGGELTLARAA